MLAGEFGSAALGTPMKVTPRLVRQDWKIPTAVNMAVVGLTLASGTVAAVDPPAFLPLPAGMAEAGS